MPFQPGGSVFYLAPNNVIKEAKVLSSVDQNGALVLDIQGEVEPQKVRSLHVFRTIAAAEIAALNNRR